MKLIKLVVYLILTFSFTISNGQNLKRKARFGTYTININDSIAQSHKLKSTQGVLIQNMGPGATADALGLKKFDIIIKLNDIDISNNNEYLAVVSTIREGDNVSVEYLRKNKKQKSKAEAIGKPMETSDSYEVIYDEVAFNNGYLRTIITKPNDIINAPAIVFLPGYNCYSLDNIGKHPYGQMIDGLTKKGYVVIRIEKLGEGDCWNTPNCEDIDFDTELEAFDLGIKSIKKYDFIDQKNVFIWGHSLGAVQAMLLAERNPIKGIIVNGTTIYSWYEYLLKLKRYQQPLLGEDYADVDELMDDYINLQYEFLIQKKGLSELAKNESYKELLEDQQFDGNNKIFGRNYRFWQQLQDVKQIEALKNSQAHLLSIWSSADFEAFSEEEHKIIAEIVNHYHPGNGTFIRLENTTHSFTKVNSMQHGLDNHFNYQFIIENFNPEIIEVSHSWISSITD